LVKAKKRIDNAITCPPWLFLITLILISLDMAWAIDSDGDGVPDKVDADPEDPKSFVMTPLSAKLTLPAKRVCPALIPPLSRGRIGRYSYKNTNKDLKNKQGLPP